MFFVKLISLLDEWSRLPPNFLHCQERNTHFYYVSVQKWSAISTVQSSDHHEVYELVWWRCISHHKLLCVYFYYKIFTLACENIKPAYFFLKTFSWEIYNRGTFQSKNSLRALVLISRQSSDHFIISNSNLYSFLKAQVKSLPFLYGDIFIPNFFQSCKSWYLRQPHL